MSPELHQAFEGRACKSFPSPWSAAAAEVLRGFWARLMCFLPKEAHLVLHSEGDVSLPRQHFPLDSLLLPII